MSNIHAYEPQTDGIFSFVTGPALPGRDPLTGQFVSSKDEDELNNGPVENYLDLSFETAEECEARIYGESLDDPLTGGDTGHSWFDDGCRQAFYDERDHWVEYLGLSWTASLEEETEAWAKYQYGHLAVYGAAEDVAEEIGEAYEHLPTRRSDSAAGRFPGLDVFNARIYRRQNTGSIGDRQRFVKIRGKKIRADRQNTHRQMDSVWMAEVTDLENGLDSWGVMQAYLDAHSALETARIEAWWDGQYYDRLLNVNGINENFIHNVWLPQEPHAKDDFDWDAYYDELMFSEEERQRREQWHYMNLDDAFHCGEFGYYDRKGPMYVEFYVGMEEDLKAAEEDNSIRHTGLFSSTWDGMDDYVEPMGGYRSGFYAWEIQAEIDYDEAAAEADWIERESQAEEDRLYQELADMGPTQEEWEAMEAEERAEEEAAEKVAEAEDELYEHVPMGNATGTKARLGHRILLDA